MECNSFSKLPPSLSEKQKDKKQTNKKPRRTNKNLLMSFFSIWSPWHDIKGLLELSQSFLSSPSSILPHHTWPFLPSYPFMSSFLTTCSCPYKEEHPYPFPYLSQHPRPDKHHHWSFTTNQMPIFSSETHASHFTMIYLSSSVSLEHLFGIWIFFLFLWALQNQDCFLKSLSSLSKGMPGV